MKRLFAVLIACIFLCSAAMAEGGSKPADDGVKALLAAGEEILYVRNDGIDARNEQGEFQPIISCGEIHKALYSGDRIYVNSEKERSRIFAYDLSGEKAAEYPLAIDGVLYDYAVTGPYLGYVYEEKQQRRTHLAVMNIQTGKVKEYDQVLNPMAVAADGDYLMVSCDILENVKTGLVLLDLRDDELTIAAERPPYGGKMHLNISEDVCYVTDQTDVYKISWSEQTSQTVRLPLSNDSKAFCIAGGVLYGYPDENGGVSRLSLNDLQTSTLVVAGYSAEHLQDNPGIAKTVSLLQEKYGTQVVFRFYSSIDDMILALMSGEPIDLLLLTNFHYANFVKADVLLDLNDLPQIQEKRESGMYSDWYFTLTGERDRLSMLPIGYVGCSLWEADANLLEQLKLELPGDNWTWDDFLTLAKQCGEKDISIMTDEHSQYYSTPSVINYINTYVDVFARTADFDTDEFRTMCEVWNTCLEEGLVSDASLNKKNLLSEADFSPAFFGSDAQVVLLYPPMIAEKRVVDAEAALIGISRNSKQQDLALEFLLTYLSPEAQTGTYLPDPLIFSDYSWYAEHYPDAMTKEQFDFYQEVLSMASLRDEMIPIRHTVNKCLTQYFTHEISLDDALREIGQRVSMMLFE